MVTFKIEKNTWHYKLANMMDSSALTYNEVQDFCSYSKLVFGGMLLFLLLVSIGFTMLVGITEALLVIGVMLFDTGKFEGVIFSDTGVAITTMVGCGLMLLIIAAEKGTKLAMAVASNLPKIKRTPQFPGFFTLLWNTIKDSTCFRVEIKLDADDNEFFLLNKLNDGSKNVTKVTPAEFYSLEGSISIRYNYGENGKSVFRTVSPDIFWQHVNR